MQKKWVVSGVIEVPVEKAWEALLEVYPNLTAADRDALKKSSQPFKTIHGQSGEGKIYLEVDPFQHSIAVQGEWWYCGVHAVQAHERGSLLEYCVYNIAPRASRWMASLVQGPEHARTMNSNLQNMLSTLGKQLSCKTYLLKK
jgi:hypothetical protein